MHKYWHRCKVKLTNILKKRKGVTLNYIKLRSKLVQRTKWNKFNEDPVNYSNKDFQLFAFVTHTYK